MKNFVEYWSGRGYEKGEAHAFWLSFLRDVLNISKPEKFIRFEIPVKLKHRSFIDAFLPDTKVIIEQKSSSVNLEKNQTQSDGEILSPFEQAQRYGVGLPVSMHPRKIIVCNFKEFLIYDMETLSTPKKILLEELPERHAEFKFLVEEETDSEVKISLEAGEITKKILKILNDNYKIPSEENKIFANKLCTRFIFCLYAESVGIFKSFQFRNFLNPIDENYTRENLEKLFEVLNTPPENRDEELSETFSQFPYVNGKLFDEKIKIPKITGTIKYYLFAKPNDLPNFSWAKINPTVFGSVFESLFTSTSDKKNSADKKLQDEDEKLRREGGIHFTNIKNIHKVIDPLFLDELHEEFSQIKKSPSREKFLAFQEKIASLKFFDPACGSGNFLTETFLSLRRLENEILRELGDGEIKVSINQFYGIELNNFAVELTKLALCISELQMAQETSEIIHREINLLPLKNSANIFEGNALRRDWEKICPEPNYIFGNPPFVGKKEQITKQKRDLREVFRGEKNINNLDYVSCWYMKAIKFMKNKNIRAAFVSTSSITQGEQIPALWEILLKNNLNVIFAYKNFQWKSESFKQAHVRCVIIGFVYGKFQGVKKIFDGDQVHLVENINPYLLDAPNIIVKPSKKNIFGAKKIVYGNMPIDKGNLILSDDEVKKLLKENPDNKNFIRRYIGGDELIYKTFNWCLWLKNISPEKFSKSKIIMQHIKATKNFREQSSRSQTKKLAETSWLFGEIRQPDSTMLVIPKVTGGTRKYIPIDFVEPEIIVSGSALIIPEADLYDFGILTSSVHMAWVRAVGGYFGTSYQYSASMVYNTFPFCEPIEQQRKKIKETAQKILDARKKYPEASLAELYDENLMPKDLREAHRKNDFEVMSAYGFAKNLSEEKILRELITLYKNLTNTE